MRDGGSLGLVAPADLDGQDRLAHLERPIGQGQEPLGPPDALDEEHDGERLGIVEAVREVVTEVDDDLRAGADDATPADPIAVVEEGVGDAAGLADAGHAAASQPGMDLVDVGGAAGASGR